MTLDRLGYAGIFLGGRGPLIVVREHEAADGSTVRYEINRGDGATAGGVCQLHELPARVRDYLDPRESGGSLSEVVCPECQKSPCIGHPQSGQAPVLNKSGGSQRDEMQCSAFNGDGAPCRRSRVAGASCCEAHGGRLPRLNKSGGSDVERGKCENCSELDVNRLRCKCGMLICGGCATGGHRGHR